MSNSIILCAKNNFNDLQIELFTLMYKMIPIFVDIETIWEIIQCPRSSIKWFILPFYDNEINKTHIKFGMYVKVRVSSLQPIQYIGIFFQKIIGLS